MARNKGEKVSARNGSRRRKAAAANLPRPRAEAAAPESAALRRAPVFTFRKSAVTIEFDNEGDLRDRLTALLTLIEPGGGETERALTAAVKIEPCLSLFQAIEIVTQALAPHPLDPLRTLGQTYLSPQERELFQSRVMREVRERRCDIAADEIPADVNDTHGSVVTAVREKAH